MIINRLHINNFRCFNSFAIEFGDRATVIFGKNGTGKTTLMHALHKALSFIMYTDRISEPSRISGKRKKKVVEIHSIAKNNPYLKMEGFSKLGEFNNLEAPYIEIAANSLLDSNIPLDWKMSALATNSRLRKSEFIGAFRQFYTWHQETGKLPLIAYFSDSFPHKEDNKKAIAKKKISALRNFGYFDWNAEEGCSKEWITRLEDNLRNIIQDISRIEKLSASGDDASTNVINSTKEDLVRRRREVDIIENCLQNFSRNLSVNDKSTLQVVSLGLHSYTGRLCVITDTGDEISFSSLPSGYKRVLGIALDLAYRSFILSGNSATEVAGIAMIDEIDLHLHPELENVILSAFLRTFPHIQFIVTTHSINVLTTARADGGLTILRMTKGASAPEYVRDIFGLDIKSGQQEVMEVSINDFLLDRYISQCAYMRYKGFGDKSRNIETTILNKGYISGEELEKRIQRKLAELH